MERMRDTRAQRHKDTTREAKMRQRQMQRENQRMQREGGRVRQRDR